MRTAAKASLKMPCRSWILMYVTNKAMYVKMTGYSAREIETDKTDTLYFEHVWEEKAAVHEEAPIHFKARHVMISDRFTDQMNSIQTDFSCHVLRDQHKSEDERFEACALQAFEEVKKILSSNSGGRELIQIVVPQEADRAPLRLNGAFENSGA
ncbi:hypothetical protein QNN00_18865 [Bacillus velezensis]|nr:hypothetical protein [Bacillus velezensis]